MLDEQVARIATRNRLARDRAAAQVSTLIDITARGTADEFSRFIAEYEADIGGPRREPLAEDESPEVVGGDGGDAIAPASSG